MERIKVLTNDHDYYTNQHTPTSSQSLTNETGSDSTNEAPNLIDGNNKRDEVRASTCVGVDTKGLGESRAVDKTSHQPIVKTDEEETQTCQRGDCEKEGISLEDNSHDRYMSRRGFEI